MRPPPPPHALPSKVFISYSSKNISIATAIALHLESHGIPCWIAPRDIKPGTPNYGKAILNGLTNCQALVLLLTEASNRSQHVMREVERAVHLQLPMLIVRLHPTAVSRDLEYYISSSQFLDITPPPLAPHFPTVERAVRDILAATNRRQGNATFNAVDHTHTRKQHLWFGLAATALVGTASLLVVWRLIPPKSPGNQTPSITTAEQSDATKKTPGDTPAAVAGDTKTLTNEELGVLLEGTDKKGRGHTELKDFAKKRLAHFHKEALIATLAGTPKPGNSVGSDVEIVTSIRLQANREQYFALSKELTRLLANVALEKNEISSDGLRTSDRLGTDAKPYLDKFNQETLASQFGLDRIFLSNAHRETTLNLRKTSNHDGLRCTSIFLIYDERYTSEGYSSGIRRLSEQHFPDVTGAVLLLETADESFRNTTWRWFRLSPSEWSAVSDNVAWQFKCVMTLRDGQDNEIEQGGFALRQYGIGRIWGVGSLSSNMIIISPFFVGTQCDHYIPEVTMSTPIRVPVASVSRIRSVSVSIEEVPGEVQFAY